MCPIKKNSIRKMHNKSEDIDALLQEASSPMATHDAVQGSIAFGGQQSVAQMQGVAIGQAAVMAPDEFAWYQIFISRSGVFYWPCVRSPWVLSSVLLMIWRLN